MSSSSGAGVKAMIQEIAKGHKYRVLSFRWIRHPTAISYCTIYFECFENKPWLFTHATYICSNINPHGMSPQNLLALLARWRCKCERLGFCSSLFQRAALRRKSFIMHLIISVWSARDIWFLYSGSEGSYTSRMTGMSSMLREMQKRIQSLLINVKLKM